MRLNGRPPLWAEWDRFWTAWASGSGTADAARAAGVSEATAQSWVRRAGGVPPRRPVVPSGRYLTLDHRETIAVHHAAGCSQAEIAAMIGKHPSTVSRELRRNSNKAKTPGHVKGLYRPSSAHRRAQERARRPKPAKLRADVNAELHDHVQGRLRLRWSPEQIAGTLRSEFPDRPEMWVSHETIYQAIYVQSRGALKRDLAACLRTGRAVRRPKRNADARRPRVPAELLISERPAEASDRAVPGHWEGDLIVGAHNGSAIGTLVERTTRFCLLLHLPGRHGAEEVRDALVDTIRALPEMLRGSLTWDQGSELARHSEITLATNLDIYFCDPHSPWQRGSNENTNGLLRQYFPKGTDLRVHSKTDLDHVARELNDRPRKTLGFKSPRQALTELLRATAA